MKSTRIIMQAAVVTVLGIPALEVSGAAPAYAQQIAPTQQYESSLYKRAPSVSLDPHYGLPKAAFPNMEVARPPTTTPQSSASGQDATEAHAPSPDAPNTATASGEAPAASRDQDFFSDSNDLDLAKLRRPSAGIVPSLAPSMRSSPGMPSSFSSSSTISSSTRPSTTMADSWRSPAPTAGLAGDASTTSDTPLFTTSEGMTTGGTTTGDTTGAFTTK